VTESKKVSPSLEALPLFAEWDRADFGLDIALEARELFAAPRQGLLRGTDGSVVVYRNADVRTIGALPEATHQPIAGFADHCQHVIGREAEALVDFIRPMTFTMRQPEHRAHKQLQSRRLSTRSVERFRSDADAAIDAQLTRLADGSDIDFVRDFAESMLADFWGRVLGLTPEEGQAVYAAMTELMPGLLRFGSEPERLRAAISGAERYLDALLPALERGTREGKHALLAELTADFEDLADSFRELGDVEGSPNPYFARTLLDGFHTMATGLASVMHALLSDESSWARVRADPALVSLAVLEGLRLHHPVILTKREALNDFEYDGVVIPEGTALSMMWLYANRDPSVFDDPDNYRLDRENRGKQTQFGGGLYACTGRNMARMLCEAMISALANPRIDIVAGGDVRWVTGSVLHELEHMPVTLRRR
jgi:cytochrome P450